MTKIHRPTGLIRYDSAQGFAGKKTQWLRTRTIVYSVLLCVGASVGFWALSTIRPAGMSIARMRSAPYVVDADYVRNQFLVRLVNKREEPTRFVLTADNLPKGAVTHGFETVVEVGPLGEEVRPYIVQVPRLNYAGRFVLRVVVRDETKSFTLSSDAEFIGPDPELLKEDVSKR